VVGDLETGETLFECQMPPGHGDIAMCADGSHAFVANHPPALRLEGERALYLFDLNQRALVERIGALSSQLCFVSSGEHLVSAPPTGFVSSGSILLIDAETNSITGELASEAEYIWGGMDAGPKSGQ
jgi:hypothetical protein